MTQHTHPDQHAVEHPSDERPHSGDQLLTIAEAAAIVRAPVATLRYWRHLGTGPRSFRVDRTSATGAPTSPPGSSSRRPTNAHLT